jgi:hypothetical protein
MSETPNPFAALRQQAADKMDRAVQAAREEYRAAVCKINQLQEYFGQRPKENGKLKVDTPIAHLVEKHIPRDRPFTCVEIECILEALYPQRALRKVTIKSAICGLAEKQVIRRVSREKNGYVVWVHADCEAIQKPYAAMTMAQVMAEVLKDRPCLRLSEIVVAIQTLGYRENDDPSALLRTVRKAAYNSPRKFVRNDAEQWSLVPQKHK